MKWHSPFTRQQGNPGRANSPEKKTGWLPGPFQVKFIIKQTHTKLPQSCPTLCIPMDCSPPGSSVHGILQARTVEWVAIPLARGPSPQGLNLGLLDCRRFFTCWATRGAPFTKQWMINTLLWKICTPVQGCLLAISVGFKTVLGVFIRQYSASCSLYMASLGGEKHQEGLWKLGNLHVGEQMSGEMEWVSLSKTTQKLLQTSLVVQQTWICLPMQGTWVESLVQEDTKCWGATEPTRLNLWSPCTLEAVLWNKRSPCSRQLEKSSRAAAITQCKRTINKSLL